METGKGIHVLPRTVPLQEAAAYLALREGSHASL